MARLDLEVLRCYGWGDVPVHAYGRDLDDVVVDRLFRLNLTLGAKCSQ